MAARTWTLPLILAGLVTAATAAAPEKGFVKLFNGKNLDGLHVVGVPPTTFRVEDGVIKCTGKPNGYIATKGSYKNYIVRFDWKYPRPADLADDANFRGNSGLFIHITGEHKVWPKSVEVQLMNRDAGNIFGLGGSKCRGKKDAAAQKKAIKPVGEWNREEVIVEGAHIVVKINGITVCTSESNDLEGGPLGWQSEGAEIHFRNLEIKELK